MLASHIIYFFIYLFIYLFIYFILQDVIKTIGEVPIDSQTARPKRVIKVIDSGVLDLSGGKYDLSTNQVDSDEDVM